MRSTSKKVDGQGRREGKNAKLARTKDVKDT